MIDYIYHFSTSTSDITGEIITTESYYYIPLFDFIMIATVLFFTVLFLKFIWPIFYPKNTVEIRTAIVKRNILDE